MTYDRTELGLSLHEAVRGRKRWAETHMGAVVDHRERYDRAQAAG